jgi:hypothetical protein
MQDIRSNSLKRYQILNYLEIEDSHHFVKFKEAGTTDLK